MKVLVTGASGFIATHLASALEARGDTVVRIQQDLDMRLPTDVDGVFHLAGYLGSRDAVPDPLAALRTNARLAEFLIATYQQLPIPIVVTSTSEVYYGQPTALPTPETAPIGWSDPFAPRWAYAQSKFLAEQLLVHAAAAGRMQVRIARLGNVYGPGARHGVVHDLIQGALSGQPWTVRNPEDSRTFCYVEDVVEGLIRLLDHPNRNSVLGVPATVNLAGAFPLRIGQLSRDIRLHTGAPAPQEVMTGPVEERWPSSEQARLLLDWTPRVSLHDGLVATIAWMKGAHETA